MKYIILKNNPEAATKTSSIKANKNSTIINFTGKILQLTKIEKLRRTNIYFQELLIQILSVLVNTSTIYNIKINY